MTTDSIAQEIFTELGEPGDLTVNSISYWLRTHVGNLNSKINTQYAAITTGTAAISQTITDGSFNMQEEEKDIFKQLYLLHYYDKEIRKHLGAAAVDPIVEVQSDGAKVRLVNRNELSKSYISIRKQEQESLDNLISSYKISKARPIQVAGTDTIEGQVIPTYRIRNDWV